MNQKIQSERSSGNVFADIGIPNPEQALAKAELARQINKIIIERRISQPEAASLLGIDQPRVSALRNGRLSFFSLEKMMQFAARLGNEVEISVKPSGHSGIRVAQIKTQAEGCYVISTAIINGEGIDLMVAMNKPYKERINMRMDNSGIQSLLHDGGLVAA